MEWTRRRFLEVGAAVGVIELAGCARPRSGGVAAPGLGTIREAGASRGILAGCAVNVGGLRDDPGYAALVTQQAGIVVAENEMKFVGTEPERGRFRFDDADFLFDFARKGGMKVRGHNFVWHRALPKWFETNVTDANAAQVLVEHIEAVGGRYAGRVHSWDVVNEAIELKDGLAGGMRNSPWQKVLPVTESSLGYVEVAFRAARRVDPKALLVYNDYGIEGDDAGSAKKRTAVLALLRRMQAAGVPVDGLGIQSHIGAGSHTAFGPDHAYGDGLRGMIADARAMGLKVLITEMDVNDRELPADVTERDAAVAATYKGYLKAALADEAVIAVLTWGITDRYTWLNSDFGRKDKLRERCLPFDEELKPTPAFEAMRQGLENRG